MGDPSALSVVFDMLSLAAYAFCCVALNLLWKYKNTVKIDQILFCGIPLNFSVLRHSTSGLSRSKISFPWREIRELSCKFLLIYFTLLGLSPPVWQVGMVSWRKTGTVINSSWGGCWFPDRMEKSKKKWKASVNRSQLPGEFKLSGRNSECTGNRICFDIETAIHFLSLFY